jgi:hypothetical protein
MQLVSRIWRYLVMQKFLPALALLLASCKEATVSNTHPSFKDAIVKEYLARIDSLDFHDTINYDFKILKAYFKDDTSFFMEMQKDIDNERKYGNSNSYLDSCASLMKLSDMNVDEVYRFRHSESFCFYSQFVTISRKDESILLHYLEISFSPDGKTIIYQNKNGGKKIGPGCIVEKEFSKVLNIKEWKLLEYTLAKADYWLLKEREVHGCCDGTFWTIDAYTKRPIYYTGQQIHSVYRWSPQNAFADFGRLFMKLSGEKSMCGSF